MSTNKIIGIDLGSYNSAVSVYEGNEVKIIQNSEGNLTRQDVYTSNSQFERTTFVYNTFGYLGKPDSKTFSLLNDDLYQNSATSSTISYDYYQDGLLKSQLNANNLNTAYEYDVIKNVTSTKFSDGKRAW